MLWSWKPSGQLPLLLLLPLLLPSELMSRCRCCQSWGAKLNGAAAAAAVLPSQPLVKSLLLLLRRLGEWMPLAGPGVHLVLPGLLWRLQQQQQLAGSHGVVSGLALLLLLLCLLVWVLLLVLSCVATETLQKPAAAVVLGCVRALLQRPRPTGSQGRLRTLLLGCCPCWPGQGQAQHQLQLAWVLMG